jgi:hypothetical protein
MSVCILLDTGSIAYTKLIRLNASSQAPLDRMLYSTDILAKSFYSTVLCNLGSNSLKILTDEVALQYYTSKFKGIQLDLVSSSPTANSYDAIRGGPGKPKLPPQQSIRLISAKNLYAS